MNRETGTTELLRNILTDYKTRRNDDETYGMPDDCSVNTESMRDNAGFSVQDIALCLKYIKN
jgi:hypothetical protein